MYYLRSEMISNLGAMEVLGAVTLVVAGIWYYLVANNNFWKKLGVPGPEPSLFFGNFKDVLFVKVSAADFLKNICDQFAGAPMIGIYQFRTPVLLLRDLDLLKDVLIKDFASFSDRGVSMHEKVEPLSPHLFHLETKRWRPLRSRLSPAFTSGKIRHMFTLILECADHFEQYVDDLVEKGEPIDCQEISAAYATDVIGSCAFGLQMRSHADKESEFRKMGRRIFQMDTREKMMKLLRNALPWLYRITGESKKSREVTGFFTTSIKRTMEYRRKNNVRKGDFIEILLEIQDNADKLDFELTDNLIAAQAFVFFFAGFETSSATISHALYELAQVQDVQDKLRQEILESLQASDGTVSYDSVKALKYLDMVFKETLRLRPPIFFHMRKAVRPYTFRGTNITIPAGQKVWIPIWDIHQNPEYFPNPQAFDPERFSEEMCKARHPMTYSPFGDGPRNCIGARFAVYQTKLGLIKILAKHKVEVCEKTVVPYQPNPKGLLLGPVGGVHLKFSRINRSK